MAALIGAVILYTLTSAAVREFALMLGLASVLDLVATYFFLRPLVRLMSRTQAAVDNPGLLGLPDAPQRARA
jgi:preprotein translocase subunit SecD